jgi:hypothetical protein
MKKEVVDPLPRLKSWRANRVPVVASGWDTESRARERKDAMKENDKYGGLLLNITTFILNDSKKYKSYQLSYRLSV